MRKAGARAPSRVAPQEEFSPVPAKNDFAGWDFCFLPLRTLRKEKGVKV